MNQHSTSNVQHYQLYPKLPDRPGWQMESLIELGAALDGGDNAQLIQNAASSVHETWTEWSLKAERILVIMGDTILRLEIPKSCIVGLIEIASQYPTKPSLPKRQIGVQWSESLAQHVRQHFDNTWEHWANWVRAFYEHIGLTIFRFRGTQVSAPFRSGTSSQNNVERLNIAGLSISERAIELEIHDPRRIFRDMLGQQEQPEIGTNVPVPHQFRPYAEGSVEASTWQASQSRKGPQIQKPALGKINIGMRWNRGRDPLIAIKTRNVDEAVTQRQ